jgi:hypothetical protein
VYELLSRDLVGLLNRRIAGFLNKDLAGLLDRGLTGVLNRNFPDLLSTGLTGFLFGLPLEQRFSCPAEQRFCLSSVQGSLNGSLTSLLNKGLACLFLQINGLTQKPNLHNSRSAYGEDPLAVIAHVCRTIPNKRTRFLGFLLCPICFLYCLFCTWNCAEYS